MPYWPNVRHALGDMLRQHGVLPGGPSTAWSQRGYEAWFRAHRATASELAAQRETRFEIQPRFSIIVPLFKTTPDYFDRVVASVVDQTYPRFELILVNASPEDAVLAAAVEAACACDERVREVRLDGNHGITENTNRGIDAATGDFLCFLDHDDFIEPDLLFEYAKALQANSQIDVLYCDEDLVDVDSRGVIHHVHPLFKPAYSPELLLCKNYIVHLMTIRADIVRSMPRPTRAYDGAQDYNMILYATSQARAVHGVQRVLYHWRMSEQSTAAKPHAKPYSQRAYRRSAFNRIGSEYANGKIVGSGIINIHNVWFESHGDAPRVSVLVDCGAEGSPDDELRAFEEGFAQTNGYENFEMLFTQPGKDLYARLNEAARQATGEYLLFVSAQDLFLSAQPLEQLLGLCSNDRIGAVASKTLYVDYSVKNYGIAVTPETIMPLYRGYADEFPAYQCNTRAFQNLSAVSWEGMMVARSDFDAVGGFDESFESVVGSADFCHRLLERGLRIVQVPTVKMQSAEEPAKRPFDHESNSQDFSSDDIARFDMKWPGVRMKGDPFFNRNLDQASEYYRI